MMTTFLCPNSSRCLIHELDCLPHQSQIRFRLCCIQPLRFRGLMLGDLSLINALRKEVRKTCGRRFPMRVVAQGRRTFSTAQQRIPRLPLLDDFTPESGVSNESYERNSGVLR
ncbi:hypothetical protein AVEN_56408-1 [Araneus ventricosus]|uniref:Uncharacterized protein n=1 Tax=Araneus ventricosus TaxID=182803 RepID=A0A4Y2GK26_ARAVE|nr:hypothetical protein AVEN_56408-1 [Araneus ventricosus]